MNESEKIQQAIANLEAQRAILGDETVSAAIDSLRKKLVDLECDGDMTSSAMEGERKLVTVMFADISGFTAMSETMDPETVRDRVNACFERLVPVIEKYGGTVDKFIGDQIMALFGAPIAHENDAERALRVALEMMETLEAFNTQHLTDLGLHFGINTGLVLAGGVGTEKRHEYSVMGDVVNLASRLEDASQRKQILVGPDTYRLTVPLFEFEALTPIQVEGKAKPVPVYRLLGSKAQPGQVRGLKRHGIQSPLVGRDAELAAFTSCISRLLTGEGSIIMVIGEAGLGKSRLVAEARDGIPAERLIWLEGRTLSFSQTISYWPFQGIIRQYAGITEDDSEVVAWAKLKGQIMTLFPDQVAEVLPYLANLLALEVREGFEERVKYLDGEAMGRQIFLTSRRFFERLAQERPLVLLFEDLQWADESSIVLLEHLLSLVKRVPLLIGGVRRPDRRCPAANLQEVAQRKYAECYKEIRLAPLTQADSVQLVRNLLKIEDLPVQVERTILQKAEGNPFFVEEVIRSLIDTKTVVHDARTGRWQVTAQLRQVSIPDTVQGVVMARIDRLEEELRQVLRIAAVIGRSFLYRVLRATMEADRELDQCLGELQRLEVIREKQIVPELEFIFKHALVHEATYRSILLKRRRELHIQVGRCIEMLFDDRLEEFYGLLAYHYAQAEDWDKAQQYLFKVGDQASKMAADAEALIHYEHALEAYTRAFGDRWDPVQRAALDRKMGDAFFRIGDHQRASEHLQRALSCLDSPFPTSTRGVQLQIIKQIVQQAGQRLLPGFFLKSEGEDTIQILEERSRIYEVMLWMDFYTDPERAVLDAICALNSAERSGFSLGVINGYATAGIMCNVMGLFRFANYYHRRAVALAEQIQHPAAIGMAYCGLTVHELYLGQFDDTTISHAQRAADMYWASGHLREWGTVVPLLHFIHLHRGNFNDSEKICHNLIQIGLDGSDPQLRSWGLLGLGRIGRRTGPFDEAIGYLQEAIEFFKAIPDYAGQTDASAELGLCYLRQGKLRHALIVLQGADQLVTTHGVKGHQVTLLYNALAEASLVAAERAEERDKVGSIREAKYRCHMASKRSKLFRVRVPHAMRLQGRYEWMRNKPERAQKWWQQGLSLAQQMGLRYEQGMTYLDMGQRLGKRAYLEQAEAIFTEIGAEWDLVQTREALGGID